MSRFWSPVVGTLSPYVPGEQPKLQNLVKLNTNEHPYGPSPTVLEAIRAAGFQHEARDVGILLGNLGVRIQHQQHDVAGLDGLQRLDD